jgi:hypothetical protein
MTYSDLARFIEHDMRMSHVYQPVFLMLMLEAADGAITENEAAAAFRDVMDSGEDVVFDVRRYPCEVLINRGVIRRADRGTYHLLGFDQLRAHERRSLVDLCDARLEVYLSEHRSPVNQLGPGRVYVLISAATPTLFKVGFTTTRAAYRAKEISRGTGVPADFQVYYESVRVNDA